MTDQKVSVAEILTPELAEFAHDLLDQGFKVYVFKSDVSRVAKGGKARCATHLGFTREVDGKEYFASVSDTLAGYQFSMAIKPSRAHGSSMWIGRGDNMRDSEDLTIANAETYASPTGFNPLVGLQMNDNRWSAGLYVEVAR